MNAAARRPARPGQPLTAEDAHRRLPLVRAITADIVRLHRDLADRRERLAAIRKLPGGKRREGSVYAEELEQVEREIGRDEETLKSYVAELEALGGVLRDPGAGRIEFGGRLDGRKVFFGWRAGDEDLSYWRPHDSEESERYPLLEGSVPQDGDAT
jgi:hypothetical protein